MLRKTFLVLLAAGLLAGFASATSALFTSTASVASNSFTTGTLNLTATPGSTALTISAMAPGDQVTGPITLANTGSLELRYAMTSSTTDDAKSLSTLLDYNIKTGISAANCTDANFAGNGTSIASGKLSTAAIGDLATHTGPTLLGGDSQVLCFNVSLPLTTGNGAQGGTTTTTFTFNAEQTANNP